MTAPSAVTAAGELYGHLTSADLPEPPGWCPPIPTAVGPDIFPPVADPSPEPLVDAADRFMWLNAYQPVYPAAAPGRLWVRATVAEQLTRAPPLAGPDAPADGVADRPAPRRHPPTHAELRRLNRPPPHPQAGRSRGAQRLSGPHSGRGRRPSTTRRRRCGRVLYVTQTAPRHEVEQVNMRFVGVRIPPDVVERLDRVAGAEGGTRSAIIRRLIDQGLDQQEGARPAA